MGSSANFLAKIIFLTFLIAIFAGRLNFCIKGKTLNRYKTVMVTKSLMLTEMLCFCYAKKIFPAKQYCSFSLILAEIKKVINLENCNSKSNFRQILNPMDIKDCSYITSSDIFGSQRFYCICNFYVLTLQHARTHSHPYEQLLQNYEA